MVAILGVALSGVVTLTVSGTRAEVDMSRRFQAQQEARLAVDRMREEIRCASALTLSSGTAITIALPASCPTAGGTAQNVTYDIAQVATGRYRLRRAGARVADYLTSANVFSYTAPSLAALGKLRLDLAVDLTPSDELGLWRLRADVVLRNTARA